MRCFRKMCFKDLGLASSTSSIASACISGWRSGEGRYGDRSSGDDGDADPAHPGAHGLWRHGCVEAHRKAGRAACPSIHASCRWRGSTKWWMGLARSMAAGHRAYWVCPLVEESELVDLAAAEDRFKALEQRFPGRVGLVHGRMKGSRQGRGDGAISNPARSRSSFRPR